GLTRRLEPHHLDESHRSVPVLLGRERGCPSRPRKHRHDVEPARVYRCGRKCSLYCVESWHRRPHACTGTRTRTACASELCCSRCNRHAHDTAAGDADVVGGEVCCSVDETH